MPTHADRPPAEPDQQNQQHAGTNDLRAIGLDEVPTLLFGTNLGTLVSGNDVLMTLVFTDPLRSTRWWKAPIQGGLCGALPMS